MRHRKSLRPVPIRPNEGAANMQRQDMKVTEKTRLKRQAQWLKRDMRRMAKLIEQRAQVMHLRLKHEQLQEAIMTGAVTNPLNNDR
jgi:hypothetical protein